MTAIIDYGVGNLFSLKSSFASIGEDAIVTADPDELRAADRLILPGVGAFGDAAEKLAASGLDRVLVEEAKKGKIDSFLVQTLISKTVMYSVDTYVKLSNGISGFVVVEDNVFNRPIIYDCVYKKFYDLKKLQNVCIIYAV